MRDDQRLERHSTGQQYYLDRLEYLSSMRRGRDCHVDHRHHHDDVGVELFDPKEENEMDRRQRYEGRLMQRQKCRGEYEHDCYRDSLM